MLLVDGQLSIIYSLKRYSSDQFVAYLNQKILADLEESKFDILSQLREKVLVIVPN